MAGSWQGLLKHAENAVRASLLPKSYTTSLMTIEEGWEDLETEPPVTKG